jgi:ATP adenylyltransferase
MERLWAPWRMEYILGEDKPDGCIFCTFPARASSRGREDLVLAVEEHAFVCLNRYPFTAAHLMVVPRRHVSDLSELSDVEASALFALVRRSVAKLSAATHCEGLNVGMNLGKAAGAGIADHLHVHVVPR